MGSSKDGRSELRARFYRGVVLNTKYGRRGWDVMDLDPGAGVLVTTSTKTMLKGTKVKGGGILRFDQDVFAGSVLLRRANPYGQPMWAVHERGLYSARRAMTHAVTGYDETLVGGTGGEGKAIMTDAAALAAVTAFLSAWKSLSAEEKEALVLALHAFVGEHEDDLDPRKVAAADSVQAVSDLCDRTGRKNPLVAERRLTHAQRMLLERFRAIEAIEPRLMLRYAVLDREIDLEVGVVRQVMGKLGKLAAYLERDAIGARDLVRKVLACRNSLGLLKAAPFANPGLTATLCLNRALAGEGKRLRILEAHDLLSRLAAGHSLQAIVEELAVLPTETEAKEARIARAMGHIKAFRARNMALFPELAEGADPEEWRAHFRAGGRALASNMLADAKTMFQLAAETLAA